MQMRKRTVAIAMLMHELDAPDLVSWDHAAKNYDHPASTGPHSGDCTNEAHTCLRCLRERVDRKAEEVLMRLGVVDSL
jgi:hypothetical protein